MWRIRFKPKAITIYINKKESFDCKNNNEHCQSAIFQLDIISKVNFRLLIVILYTLLKLGLRNV